MRTSANPSLASTPVPAARWNALKMLAATAFSHVRDAVAGVRLAVRGRRKRGVWREDLPWNVGMDHLAETGYRPWIFRP